MGVGLLRRAVSVLIIFIEIAAICAAAWFVFGRQGK